MHERPVTPLRAPRPAPGVPRDPARRGRAAAVPSDRGPRPPAPRPCRCRRPGAAPPRRPPRAGPRRPRPRPSRHGAALAAQGHHAVAGQHPAVVALGRHEIPLRLHVQPHHRRHPLPQRPADRPGRVRGVGLVACPRAAAGRCRAPGRPAPARRHRGGGAPAAPPSAGRGRAARR